MGFDFHNELDKLDVVTLPVRFVRTRELLKMMKKESFISLPLYSDTCTPYKNEVGIYAGHRIVMK